MGNKNRLVWIVAAICIVCNGFLMWKVYGRGPAGHKMQEPKQVIIEALDFDKEQTAAYEQLILAHRHDISLLESKILDARGQWYQSIDTVQTMNDSLAIAISILQADIERTHYRHFQAIRKLCKPDQVAAFVRLADQLPSLFLPKIRRKG
jgi:periplasmic protein CpxP/Spy